MKPVWILAYAVVLLLWPGMMVLAQAPDVASAPVLRFEFTERPAKREIPIAPYRLTFVCDENRRYRASHEPLAADGATPEAARAEGELLPTEWEDLQTALRGLEFPPDTPTKLNIGYGAAATPGWEGALTFTVDGTQREVLFTSLQPADGQARTVALNRLVTLVFDLKNFALAKLQRLPVRAHSPGNSP